MDVWVNTHRQKIVLVPFYRGAVVFNKGEHMNYKTRLVLVPFYRGAVVFSTLSTPISEVIEFSSPFIEERLYLRRRKRRILGRRKFSSPFIEERLYLENFKNVFVVSFSALLSWSNIDQNNGLD